MHSAVDTACAFDAVLHEAREKACNCRTNCAVVRIEEAQRRSERPVCCQSYIEVSRTCHTEIVAQSRF